jgi:hypothetical protein
MSQRFKRFCSMAAAVAAFVPAICGPIFTTTGF